MAKRVTHLKILAFDTSSSACSVSLQNGHEIKSLHKIAPMQQARLILPAIQELLDSSSLTLNQLDAIAYGCGPGSFTGMRIASSVAQGIGLATKLPIIRISSLAAIAQAAFLERQWTKLLVALDARMEEVYWAVYKLGGHGRVELIGEEQVCDPKKVTMPESGESCEKGLNWYGIGDGWEKYREVLITRLGFQPRIINALQLPTAEAILELAKTKLDQDDWVAAYDAIPTYLR
jgi:tRNA threonylcarbamoyladenosine biosynthesis protein TsaB